MVWQNTKINKVREKYKHKTYPSKTLTKRFDASNFAFVSCCISSPSCISQRLLFFCISLLNSLSFSVPFSFVKLFCSSFALQTFSCLYHCSVMLFRLFRCYMFPLFPCPFLLFNASRQAASGGIFRNIGNSIF